MEQSNIDKIMLEALCRVKGLEDISPLRPKDHQSLLDIEQKAEAQSLMGLGKVVNTGVKEILDRDLIYVALTSMDFDWGDYSTLVLKKGTEIVGKEVRDKAVIEQLSQKENVWFLHQNFVVYKDKITFPQDIMNKVCYFEIPCLPAEFCILDTDQFQCHSIDFANPCVPGDLFLKENYFEGLDEKGLGTILVGVKVRDKVW
jgi:hypothetical protein